MPAARLTTAESLVLQLVILTDLHRQPITVIERTHWVRPQLDELAADGLIDWDWDDDANFRVTARDELRLHPEYVRLRDLIASAPVVATA